MPCISIGSATGEHVNEFPFFTFLSGELQPHLLALLLALAVLGLMVALVRQSPVASRQSPVASRQLICKDPPPTAYCRSLLALVIGALHSTNTWDYPTYLGLAVATLGWAVLGRRRRGLALGAWLRCSGPAPRSACWRQLWFVPPVLTALSC